MTETMILTAAMVTLTALSAALLRRVAELRRALAREHRALLKLRKAARASARRATDAEQQAWLAALRRRAG